MQCVLYDFLINPQRTHLSAKIVHAEAKQFKAVIIRIDSGGGDALASDL